MKHRFHESLCCGLRRSMLGQVRNLNRSRRRRRRSSCHGKLQRDEILKEEQAENRKDAEELVNWRSNCAATWRRTAAMFFPCDHKKAEDIERLAHRIRTRMQHN